MAKTKKEKSIEQMLDEAIVKENDRPYRIPEHWVWVKIGKVTNVVGGGTPKTNINEYYEGGTISWLTPADLSNYGEMYIGRGRRNITELGLLKSSAKLLPKGSVLLSSRAPVGYVAIAINEIATNQGFKSFEVSDAIHSEYAYWNLKYAKDLIESMASGTTFIEISGKKAAQIPFPLPPIEEQKKIAVKLSSMLAKLKEARELVQEAKDSFENRRAAIINKAFTGELTKKWREDNPDIEDVRFYIENIENEIKKVEKKSKKEKGLFVEGYKIPNSWQWRKLDDLSFLITKGASPKWQGINYTNDKDQTLFVTSENVGSGHLILDKEKYVESKFDAKQKRSILKLGDVLLNIVGASIGRAAVFDIEKKSNINQAVALIRLADKNFNRFLNYLLNSEFAKNYYSQKKVDVARANLSLSDVANIPIPLPPLEEQKEIVRILDRILCNEDKSKELIDLEEHIDLLGKSILSKAFRGELGTNNPEDEPAIKLLERILEEKKSKPIILKPDDIKTSGSVSKPELLVKGPSDNTQVLLEEIKNKYGNKTFRANELKDISELSYDELKDALFELLESKLTMTFNENKEVITYQLKK